MYDHQPECKFTAIEHRSYKKNILFLLIKETLTEKKICNIFLGNFLQSDKSQYYRIDFRSTEKHKKSKYYASNIHLTVPEYYGKKTSYSNFNRSPFHFTIFLTKNIQGHILYPNPVEIRLYYDLNGYFIKANMKGKYFDHEINKLQTLAMLFYKKKTAAESKINHFITESKNIPKNKKMIEKNISTLSEDIIKNIPEEEKFIQKNISILSAEIIKKDVLEQYQAKLIALMEKYQRKLNELEEFIDQYIIMDQKFSDYLGRDDAILSHLSSLRNYLLNKFLFKPTKIDSPKKMLEMKTPPRPKKPQKNCRNFKNSGKYNNPPLTSGKNTLKTSNLYLKENLSSFIKDANKKKKAINQDFYLLEHTAEKESKFWSELSPERIEKCLTNDSIRTISIIFSLAKDGHFSYLTYLCKQSPAITFIIQSVHIQMDASPKISFNVIAMAIFKKTSEQTKVFLKYFIENKLILLVPVTINHGFCIGPLRSAAENKNSWAVELFLKEGFAIIQQDLDENAALVLLRQHVKSKKNKNNISFKSASYQREPKPSLFANMIHLQHWGVVTKFLESYIHENIDLTRNPFISQTENPEGRSLRTIMRHDMDIFVCLIHEYMIQGAFKIYMKNNVENACRKLIFFEALAKFLLDNYQMIQDHKIVDILFMMQKLKPKIYAGLIFKNFSIKVVNNNEKINIPNNGLLRGGAVPREKLRAIYKRIYFLPTQHDIKEEDDFIESDEMDSWNKETEQRMDKTNTILLQASLFMSPRDVAKTICKTSKAWNTELAPYFLSPKT